MGKSRFFVGDATATPPKMVGEADRVGSGTRYFRLGWAGQGPGWVSQVRPALVAASQIRAVGSLLGQAPDEERRALWTWCCPRARHLFVWGSMVASLVGSPLAAVTGRARPSLPATLPIVAQAWAWDSVLSASQIAELHEVTRPRYACSLPAHREALEALRAAERRQAEVEAATRMESAMRLQVGHG